MSKNTRRLIVNSDSSLSDAIGELRQAYQTKRFVRVTIDCLRTLDQNAQTHVWYEQVSRELREDSPEGVKAECKLRFGVPILRASDPVFREMYDAGLKHLTYEQKLKAMRYLPVTSLMNFDQLQGYLADMQNEYGPRGVKLEFLKDGDKRRAPK